LRLFSSEYVTTSLADGQLPVEVGNRQKALATTIQERAIYLTDETATQTEKSCRMNSRQPDLLVRSMRELALVL